MVLKQEREASRAGRLPPPLLPLLSPRPPALLTAPNFSLFLRAVPWPTPSCWSKMTTSGPWTETQVSWLEDPNFPSDVLLGTLWALKVKVHDTMCPTLTHPSPSSPHPDMQAPTCPTPASGTRVCNVGGLPTRAVRRGRQRPGASCTPTTTSQCCSRMCVLLYIVHLRCGTTYHWLSACLLVLDGGRTPQLFNLPNEALPAACLSRLMPACLPACWQCAEDAVHVTTDCPRSRPPLHPTNLFWQSWQPPPGGQGGGQDAHLAHGAQYEVRVG